MIRLKMNPLTESATVLRGRVWTWQINFGQPVDVRVGEPLEMAG